MLLIVRSLTLVLDDCGFSLANIASTPGGRLLRMRLGHNSLGRWQELPVREDLLSS